MLLQFHNQPVSLHQPKRLFISYSHRDREYVDLFIEALFPMKREGLVSEWHDHMIRPGEAWQQSIADELDRSNFVLFWISPTFMASRYCMDEVKQALENARNGLLTVIPILVRTVPLENNELFQLQALPPNGRPLTQYNEKRNGIRDVVEAIRLLILDARFEDESGTGGVWMLRLKSRLDGMNGVDAEGIVERLIDLTRDTSIKLIAQGTIRGSQRKPNGDDSVLVLRGSADAFEQIHRALTKDSLSTTLGVTVVDFRHSVGSTLQTSCLRFAEEDGGRLPAEETNEEILYPSDPSELPFLKGIKIDESNLFHFDFILDSAGFEKQPSVTESKKCVQQFISSLLISEDNFWVNLSAYESNRMIPAVLGGTEMGRNLLEFDCVLKQFASSLLHPDTQTGQRFWQAYFKRLNESGGDPNQAIRAFNKVWIVPERLVVYHKPPGEPVPEAFKNRKFGSFSDEHAIAYICESKLKVNSEWDLMAYNSNGIIEPGITDSIYMETFDETIVPIIYSEVNSGGRFARFRQIYHSLGLATFIRKTYGDSQQLRDYVSSNNPRALRPTVSSVGGTRINPEESVINRQNEWSVEENRFFHDRYMSLFKDGLYRVARNLDVGGRESIRVFFSGAIHFEALSKVFQTTDVMAGKVTLEACHNRKKKDGLAC
jgi:TIR domain